MEAERRFQGRSANPINSSKPEVAMQSHSDFNKALGAVIRSERKARGMSMDALGKQLGVSYQQIQKYEYGKNGCSAHLVTRIAGIFHISVADLYARVGVPLVEPAPAEFDAIEACRLMRRIESPFHRELSVHLLKKFANQGASA
jgi:transcriptional regulator with XRE-family HTH domain